MSNKKGWIKMTEAFLSILIIGSLLTFSVSSNSNRNQGLGEQIEMQEVSLLNYVQLNKSLRSEIINLAGIPVQSNEMEFPSLLNVSLNEIESPQISCLYKICSPEDNCFLDAEPSEKEIHARSVIISSYEQTFKPRILNIFCWEK